MYIKSIFKRKIWLYKHTDIFHDKIIYFYVIKDINNSDILCFNNAL